MGNNEKPFLKGSGASAGKARGKVKIINNEKNFSSFNEGDILVTRITDPSMVMLMSRAAAIVTDIGGLNSHPAIVSREMGVPCVVATKTATSDLVDGMEIVVDGTTGEIFLESFNKNNNDSDKNNDYNDLIESYRRAFLKMDSSTMETSFDYTNIDPLIAEKWMKKVLEIINEAKRQKLTDKEVGVLFHTPNTLRNNMIFDLSMASFAGLAINEKKEIADFYINCLKAVCIKDPFSLDGNNLIHNEKSLHEELKNIIPANPEIAKKIGRLINSCYHMGYSLFGDMNPQLVYENYGPYLVKNEEGEEFTAVIKEFKNMKPVEFWPEIVKLPVEKIKIVCLYQNIEFSVDAVTHTEYHGNVINGLKYYSVYADDKMVTPEKIDDILEILEKYSSFIWFIFKNLNDKEFRTLYLWQKAYNYKYLCERLGVEWKPSIEIIEEVTSKPLKKWPEFENKKERDEFFLDIIDPRFYGLRQENGI